MQYDIFSLIKTVECYQNLLKQKLGWWNMLAMLMAVNKLKIVFIKL